MCTYLCILRIYSISISWNDLGAWPNILSTCSKVGQKSVQPTKSGIFTISNKLLSNKSLQRCHKNDGSNLAPEALIHPDSYRISATNSATICSVSALHISDIQRLPWIEQVKKRLHFYEMVSKPIFTYIVHHTPHEYSFIFMFLMYQERWICATSIF